MADDGGLPDGLAPEGTDGPGTGVPPLAPVAGCGCGCGGCLWFVLALACALAGLALLGAILPG